MDLELVSHALPNYLTVIEELTKSLDDRKQVDILFLGFANTFDTVPHQHLLLKLQSNDIRTHQWILQWLTKQSQRVVINGTESDCVQVISGVPPRNCARSSHAFAMHK